MVGNYVYNFTATSGGMSVTTFSKSLTLTFTYTDSQIAGLNEDSLKIYYWTDPQGHMLQMRDDGLSNPVSAPQQQTTMVASSTNVYDYHATGSVPGMDIYLRMSADKQSYIRVTFDFFNYTIFYTTAGPTKEINIGSGLSTVVPGVVHQPASWLDVLTWTVKVLDNSVYVYANYPLNSLLGGTAGGQQGTYLLGAHPDILQGRVLRGDEV